MTTRVLITGGAGFLGSHLAQRLLRAGYRVRILDCLDPQVHPRGVPAHLPNDAELQIGSVLDREAVRRALRGIDTVVHFAAVVGVGQSLYQIARYNQTNLQGTAELLEGLLERQRRSGSGLARLLVAGSMSVYGEGRYGCPSCRSECEVGRRPAAQLHRQQWDMRCPACGNVLEPRPTGETKTLQFGSIYALSKYTQEEMCHVFGRTYAVPTVALRFFNAYGPHQALSNPYTGVAAVFANELLAGRAPQVYEDGCQLRDLVSVHDVTAACQLAMERAGAGGGTFNIASGEVLSIAQLARTLAAALGVAIEPNITGKYRLGDARHCIADISAARARLGYRPQVSLAHGMRELGAWLTQQHARRGPCQTHAQAELRAYGLTG
ncbi:MAG: NAD-dependent epimerase/dehydratase family protein [Terriglobales bacterium]